MEQSMTFGSVLEAADALSLEEKETLIDILRRRVAERRRQALVEEVQEARRDFAQGNCPAATVDEIMQELLA
jgi:hypothetical protein